MNVQAWSPHLTPERAKEAGVAFATKEELFRTSDIISIHMVASPSTFDLVASNEFDLMKPTAFLINTSRGPIVNEEALLQALNEERIAGAGLDVYNMEPLPLDSPIRSAKNVTLTPHMGYVGDTLYKVRTQAHSRANLFRRDTVYRFSGKTLLRMSLHTSTPTRKISS